MCMAGRIPGYGRGGSALWLLVIVAGWSASTQAQQADASLYVRTDSDHTTVIAPRAHARAPVAAGTHVDVTYAADIWSSASIDIRASASKPVVEQRDELDVGIDHEFNDLTLTAGYRFSTEPDYLSNGANLGFSYDFADNNATLAGGVSASFDRVGRAGDPGFSKPVRNLSARVAFTQVLGPRTLVQGIYELMQADGYNSSPYRYVGIGGPDALCSGLSRYCVPEASPTLRLRQAAAVRMRHSFTAFMSAGLGYRFYHDDWDLTTHTLLADLTFAPTNQLIIALRYRFYIQNAVSFYQARYLLLLPDQHYYTNDKELSPINEQRLALDFEQAFSIGDRGQLVRPILSVAVSRYNFSDFIPLSQIRALEITLATAFEL